MTFGLVHAGYSLPLWLSWHTLLCIKIMFLYRHKLVKFLGTVSHQACTSWPASSLLQRSSLSFLDLWLHLRCHTKVYYVHICAWHDIWRHLYNHSKYQTKHVHLHVNLHAPVGFFSNVSPFVTTALVIFVSYRMMHIFLRGPI